MRKYCQLYQNKKEIAEHCHAMAYYLRPALTPIGEAKYVVDMLVRALHKVCWLALTLVIIIAIFSTTYIPAWQ